MISNLAKNILTTITYYDVLDYPLTIFELEKYLIRAEMKQEDGEEKADLARIERVLAGGELKNLVEDYQGFYFSPNRQELVAQRMARNKISEKKIKIVLRVVRYLRFVPYLRMIAITGRLAMKNAQGKSDLDLLVVIKKGKLFTGRFLVTALVQLMGKRRYAEKIKNRICLNHFLTDEFIVESQSLFSANEYTFLLPVFGNFSEFYAKNPWIKEFKPNFYPEAKSAKSIEDSAFSKGWRSFWEKILAGKFIEAILAKWQKAKIRKNPKTSQKGGVIIYKDTELAFWPNFENQETKIFEKFSLRLEALWEKNRKFGRMA
jgi:hypothetical protein